jgi:transposase-like protein
MDKLQEAVNAVILAGGSKADAAKKLGIPRTTLVSRLDAAERENITPTVVAPSTEAALYEQKVAYEIQVKDLKEQNKFVRQYSSFRNIRLSRLNG